MPLLPDVLRHLAVPHLAANIRYRLTDVALPKGKQDLLLSELGLLHRYVSLPNKDR